MLSMANIGAYPSHKALLYIWNEIGAGFVNIIAST